MLRSFIILITCPFFILFTSSAQAGRVVKAKGKKVYLQFEEDELGTFGADDYFYLLNSKGKKKTIIHIKKVKGLKAIGKILKGKARKNYTTKFRSVGKKTKSMAKKRSQEDDYSTDQQQSTSKIPGAWGFMAGFGTASQDVKQGTSTSSQTGSSMSVKGVYDYPIMDTVKLRGQLGVEMFSVEGTGLDKNTLAQATIGSDINYLTGDFLLQWHFYDTSSMSFYLSGGLGIFMPISKSTTAVKEDSIGMLAIGEFGGGVDIKISDYIVPIDISYYYFSAGDDTTTNVISIKSGLLWRF